MENNATILVVDDTPANLEVITETLASVDYTVITAISGERALNRLKHQKPDLILLDVQMPGMDGFAVCQQLKSHPDTANIPVIFITALSDIGSIVRGFSLGAVDYISKPFQELELLTRVKTHLQLKFLTQNLEKRVVERTAALQIAVEQLQQSKLQLVQHEKMSTLGNLVAGIAHEINNPIGFLKGSLYNIEEYIKDILNHLALYQHHYPEAVAPIQADAEAINLAFLKEDLPQMVGSMHEAVNRIQSISTSLRTFSRIDTEHKISADLHAGLDSTLLILKYRLQANNHRPAIEVIQNYGELPSLECFPGQLNQVFMNILANAIDAFDEAAQQPSSQPKDKLQQITIQTSQTNKTTIEIRIRDNAMGMTEDVKSKIFDYLFTTKAVGKGTGLGLAIARQIIVEKHAGTIDVHSELNKGTEFVIRLPILL